MFRECSIALLLILTLVLVPAYGEEDKSPLDDLLIKIAVFGPSDEIFIWWGHAALIVENTRWNLSKTYDWGIFSYPSDSFLKDFIREKVRYQCTSGHFYPNDYVKEDRDITLYTLNLSRKGKELMLAYAENNVQPENAFYDYHEFRDNCSTRIRDIIDMGTGGHFRETFGEAPGRMSIRQHIRRFTSFNPFSGLFLDFMMGQDLDENTTAWDEMFLPVEIARNIADFYYMDDSGNERELVSSVQIVNSSRERQPVLSRPLKNWPPALVVGLIAAFFFFGIKTLRGKFPRAGRILWGLSQSILGLFLGGCGSVLVFAFFMNNDYFQQNANILFVNPLLLLAAPLGIIAATGKRFPADGEKCLRILWTCVFTAGGITVLARALPFFYQQNQNIQAVVLPAAFVLSYAPEWLKSISAKLFSHRYHRPSSFGKETPHNVEKIIKKAGSNINIVYYPNNN